MTTPLTIMFALLGVVFASLAVIDLVRRSRARGVRASAVLMREAGLSRMDRRLLTRMARSAGLPNAGCLLLSHGCFDHAARAAIKHGMDRDAVNRLHRRISERT